MSTILVKRGCHVAAILVVLGFGLLATGCSDPKGSVSGKVKYNDKIVKAGRVTFFGDNDWTGSSPISDEGGYTITNVPSGKMRITVDTSTAKPNPMAAKMPRPPKDANLPPGNMYDNLSRADLYVEIPANYADRDKSGLTYDATKGKQTHDISLK